MTELRIRQQAEKLTGKNNLVSPNVLLLTIQFALRIADLGKILPNKKIRFLLQSPDEEAFNTRTEKLGKRFKFQ